MNKAKKRIVDRKKRAFRVRKEIVASSDMPRLSIRRSLKHISAQLIDDISRKSIVQVSSASKEVKDRISSGKTTKVEISKVVGELIAEKAIEKGVKKVVFDRSGYLFHGRIKSLADAAREKGLLF